MTAKISTTTPALDRTEPTARRLRPRSGDTALDTHTGLLLDLTTSAGHAPQLPRGRAQGRYRCLACGLTLEYCGPRTRSDFTARFRHTRHDPDRCNAGVARQASVPAAIGNARALAQQLHATQPDVVIELAVTAVADGDCPPVLALRLRSAHNALTLHLAYASDLSPHQADQLAHTADDATRHWLLYDRFTPAHVRDLGHITVRLHRQNQRLERLTPTATQRRLAVAPVALAWRAQGLLLIPFGGHVALHEPRSGEDWTGPAASFQQDWKISHPRPAPDATWWGLVPLPLRILTAPALLAAATQTMARLERAQHGREGYRRAQARAQFTHTHTPSAPVPAAPPAQPVAPVQEGMALPPTNPIPAPASPAPTPLARPLLARLRKAVRRLFRRP